LLLEGSKNYFYIFSFEPLDRNAVTIRSLYFRYMSVLISF